MIEFPVDYKTFAQGGTCVKVENCTVVITDGAVGELARRMSMILLARSLRMDASGVRFVFVNEAGRITLKRVTRSDLDAIRRQAAEMESLLTGKPVEEILAAQQQALAQQQAQPVPAQPAQEPPKAQSAEPKAKK